MREVQVFSSLGMGTDYPPNKMITSAPGRRRAARSSGTPACRARAARLAIVSAGLRGDSLRPDLTSVALEGVERKHVVLATRRADRSTVVAAFRAAAQRHLAGLSAAAIATPS